MKRISKETRERIETLLKMRIEGYAIASETGVSEGTVTKIRKELKKEGHSDLGYDKGQNDRPAKAM